MMNELRIVLDNYLSLRDKVAGKATKPIHPEQVTIKVNIPERFKRILNYSKNFEIKGSYGQGALSLIPWVGVFNKEITKSAQNGYYIVLLFSADMQSCYLSLNQGVTNLLNNYGKSNAFYKMQQIAKHVLNHLHLDGNTLTGKIDLHAIEAKEISQGYEVGNIVAYRYDKSNLPSEQQFEQDFKTLLGYYDLLINKAGRDLQSLLPENEEDYQQAISQQIKLLAKSDDEKQAKEPEKVTYLVTTNRRDSRVAAKVILDADFKCEIDPSHNTFISNSSGKPYVEAHHLIPFSQQDDFNESLDIPANIVTLCPHCHRLLHHARWKDKESYLKQLFAKRQSALQKAGIHISFDVMKSYYNKGALID